MALANTITYAGISADLRLAAMIAGELHLKLRDVSSLRNTPWISYAGSVSNNGGSDTIRYRLVGLDGYDSFEARADGVDADAFGKALTKSHVDITAARQVLLYSITDLATMTGSPAQGDLDPFRIAMSMLGSYEARFAELTADACSNFTTTKGSGADDFSVDLWMSGLFALEQAASGRGAVGPYVAVLHPSSLVSLQDSLRNEVSNVITLQPDAQKVAKINGGHFDSGYVGELLGCSLYRSSYVNQNGAARENFMMGIDACAYIDGVPQSIAGNADYMVMDKVLVELERRATQNVTAIMGSCYLGLSVVRDASGVLLNAKA
jgi:hypothetical protein